MKKNKFLLVSILLMIILLVQPQNFKTLVSILTQNDIATQLNIKDSPEEKNGDSGLVQLQNEQLASQVYDGQHQVIVVNEKAQFSAEELSLQKGNWEKYSELD